MYVCEHLNVIVGGRWFLDNLLIRVSLKALGPLLSAAAEVPLDVDVALKAPRLHKVHLSPCLEYPHVRLLFALSKSCVVQQSYIHTHPESLTALEILSTVETTLPQLKSGKQRLAIYLPHRTLAQNGTQPRRLLQERRQQCRALH